MNDTIRDMALNYFHQQDGLGVPDYYFPDAAPCAAAQNGTTHGNFSVNAPEGAVEGDGYTAKRAALVALYREVAQCRGCALGLTRNKMVFGGGYAAAPLMIIGEAPGFDEDRQGKPFVGKAGALLTKMLAAIQIDREKDVFIANILKCRPPENRDPNQGEAAACMPILKRQIHIIAPKAILALGRIAAQELLGKTGKIAALRGENHAFHGIPVIVTYHPAALLRSQQFKRPAWEDLQKLQQLLREKGAYGGRKE